MKTGELSAVPRATHELWQELKVSLLTNGLIANGCNKGSSSTHELSSSASLKTKESSRYKMLVLLLHICVPLLVKFHVCKKKPCSFKHNAAN